MSNNKYGVKEVRLELNAKFQDAMYYSNYIDNPYVVINDNPTDEELELYSQYLKVAQKVGFNKYAKAVMDVQNPDSQETHKFLFELRRLDTSKITFPVKNQFDTFTVSSYSDDDKTIVTSADSAKCNKLTQGYFEFTKQKINWYSFGTKKATGLIKLVLDDDSVVLSTPDLSPEKVKAVAAAKKEVIKVERTIDDELAIVAKFIGKAITEAKETELQSKAEALIEEELAKRGNPIRSTYDISVINGAKEKITHSDIKPHEKFEAILKFVSADEPVYLTGPAGSGKSTICKQVAEALDLDFYMSNAVTQEYKILGFTDAYGKYQETPFYKAFKNGGIFMLDEMDASIPEALVILNTAIANRCCDFPAPIGNVKAHPDFRVIAAGNTYGTGADYDYTARSQLDAATLDRFAIIKVDYDPQIEENVSLGNKDLLTFCRQLRKAIQKAAIHSVISYRGISRACKMASALSPEELLRSCLLKGLGVDDMNNIKADMGGSTQYHTAFNGVLSQLQAEAGA